MKKALKQFSILVLAITLTLIATKELEVVKAQTSNTILSNSEIIVETGNGYGNGTGPFGRAFRRFSNNPINIGSDITYTDSITDGGYFTVNTNGLYSIFYNANSSNVQIYINYDGDLFHNHGENLCTGTNGCSATVF